jgi:hypothetical protein
VAANLNSGGGDADGIEVTVTTGEGDKPEKDPVTVKQEELEKKLNDLDAASNSSESSALSLPYCLLMRKQAAAVACAVA